MGHPVVVQVLVRQTFYGVVQGLGAILDWRAGHLCNFSDGRFGGDARTAESRRGRESRRAAGTGIANGFKFCAPQAMETYKPLRLRYAAHHHTAW